MKVGVLALQGAFREHAEALAALGADVAFVKQPEQLAGLDAIVIDLRTNGGGALAEAIEVTGLFIDQGPVVQVKEPSGYARHLRFCASIRGKSRDSTYWPDACPWRIAGSDSFVVRLFNYKRLLASIGHQAAGDRA